MPLAALDHSGWDALVKRYVNGASRVDYKTWRDEPEALDAYLEQLAAPWPAGLSAEGKKAALINAFNAITVRWILAHYPVRSIWETKKPFSQARHTLNGAKTSLDDIQKELRDMDPRIHAALVSGSRSCPPLRREAYTEAKVNQQLERNTQAWLADTRWNRFLAAERTAMVSSIFDWYDSDFEPEGVRAFLLQYAPAGAEFLRERKSKVDFIRHQWGLNDQSPLGQDYGGPGFWWDYFRNR